MDRVGEWGGLRDLQEGLGERGLRGLQVGRVGIVGGRFQRPGGLGGSGVRYLLKREGG